jgi:tetratricopeptide (TPR) repeat protein
VPPISVQAPPAAGSRRLLKVILYPVRVVRSVARRARRRPWTAALLTLLVIAIVVGSAYAYVRHQWRAAQDDVRELRLDQARDRLKICLALWPRRVEVHLLAARTARLSGDFETAEAHLNKCLKLVGPTEDVQLEYLLIRAQTGEIEEVAPILESFVENGHRDGAHILETMSRAYMQNLEYGPAYRCLSRWIVLTPEDTRPHYWRGWVFERVANPARAREDYEHALAMDPNLFSVRLRLAEMLLEDNQPVDAATHLEYLRTLDPDRPEVNARLGQCRFLQGQHAESRRLLEAAVEKLPNDRYVLLYLARLDIEDRQPARAEERLRKLLDKDQSDTEARYVLVTALKFQRRDREAAENLVRYEQDKVLIDRANKMLQSEAKTPTRDANTAFEIGSLLLQIGQEQQGLHWLNEALSRSADHQPTHAALADYYEKTGDAERAASHRRRLK